MIDQPAIPFTDGRRGQIRRLQIRVKLRRPGPERRKGWAGSEATSAGLAGHSSSSSPGTALARSALVLRESFSYDLSRCQARTGTP